MGRRKGFLRMISRVVVRTKVNVWQESYVDLWAVTRTPIKGFHVGRVAVCVWRGSPTRFLNLVFCALMFLVGFVFLVRGGVRWSVLSVVAQPVYLCCLRLGDALL